MNEGKLVLENIVNLKAPVDSGGTAYATGWVDLQNALDVNFFYYVGVMTAASADQPIVITLEAATAAASGSEVALAFTYRKTGAVNSNTWTAPAAVASTGLSIDHAGTEGVLYAFHVDPHGLDSALADARYVRMVVGIDAGGSATLNAAWAQLSPRFPQLVHVSAT